MCLEAKALTKRCIKMLDKTLKKYLSEKQLQWVWFVFLWLGGFFAVALFAYLVRLAMGIE